MSDYQDQLDGILREIRATLEMVDGEHYEALVEAIIDAERVFVSGKGRSGLQMRAFAMRLMHLAFPVHVVGEVTTPAIASGDMLLIGSGSGETASLVQYAKRAKSLSAKLGLITADRESQIAVLADALVEIPAPTPKSMRLGARSSIQPLGSLFEVALGILLDTLVLRLMVEMDVDAYGMFARHANLE